ncbi:MAG: gliding motility-associated C-terminal domain-containing protein [Bacteroidia bacterium]
MKKFYCLSFICLLFLGNVSAQSDNCATATPLTVNNSCIPVNGTTTGATASMFSGCVGNADDDVWYQFVATATSHVITVTPSGGMDPVLQLFSGTCTSLVTLNCQDAGFSGQAETVYPAGLTIGSTYTVRVYNYGLGAGTGNFTICVTDPAAAPSNNICGNATTLTVGASCVTTNGNTAGATQSYAGCVGTADDDVWFKFVATNTTATITVDPSSTMDAVVQLYSGTCGLPNSLECADNGLYNINEVINAVGLVVGNTYLVRVYDYYNQNGGGTFSICITGPPSSSTPTNDSPCTAIALQAVTSDCNYSHFTTTGATASTTAPTPVSCTGGSNGGFSSSSKDVWFTVVAPSNGKLTITPEPGYGITDAVAILYSGTCGSLTQIACSDDHNYPGTSNDTKPYISQSGLTPGATYYIRYFGFGSTSGNFGICVASPTNDVCGSALYICDLNGYSASTSAAFTPDRPCNMRGNNENTSGVDQPDGVNTGGVFGQGGSWGTGSPAFDVNINNNSWIRFTAGAATAVLNVTVGDCWKGNYPQGGVQMQIFAASGCCNFTPVSNFEENSTGFTITANSLTIGNDYYLMVDGFAGDICNYTISANSGVQFPAITAVPNDVCFGGSTTLTAPAGATSYEWTPGGSVSQSITITPSTTITYTCIASGVCGYKQTLTHTVNVNPLPVVSVNSGNNSSICIGDNASLTAAGASTYVWSTGSTASSLSVNPSADSVYTVIGTDGNGCKDTATTTVTVNPLPTVTATSAVTGPSCDGNTFYLISSGGTSYSWTGPNSFTSNQQNIALTNATTAMSGTYVVTVTDANGCVDTGMTSITVNQTPQAVAVSDVSTCTGEQLVLTATGFGTINWYSDAALTNLVQANSSTFTPPVPTGTITTYYVTATSNGCESPSASATVSNFNVVASGFASDTIGFTPIDVLFTNTSIGVDSLDSFFWNFGDENTANTYHAAHTYTEGGDYNVILIVTETTSGCFDTAFIHVVFEPGSELIIPNIFTPNGDGTNDVFTVIGTSIKDLHADIFDRWGIKMYELNGANSGWDGKTRSGALASDGTYYYILRAEAFDNKTYEYHGAFQLQR